MRYGVTLVTIWLATLAGCRCSPLSGEVDDLAFTRCSKADAPAGGSFQTGALAWTVEDRTLTIQSSEELRIVAFTGPVGAALSRGDQALIAQQKPNMVFFVGGLGDDEAAAASTLSSLEALRVPTLFLAGGADRLPVVTKAFEGLSEQARQYILHVSGLREVRFGNHRFAIVSGSPQGRYAVDDQACGFDKSDLEQAREALGDSSRGGRTWLLSWAAPSGFGVSNGEGGVEVGSPELFAFAQAVAAEGGLFAYPETQTGTPTPHGARKALSLVVPRLGRVGSARVGGGRIPSAVAVLTVTRDDLTLRNLVFSTEP